MNVYNSAEDIRSEVEQRDGSIRIRTNAKDSWSPRDHITFVHEDGPILFSGYERDALTVTARIEEAMLPSNNASVGVMIRSGPRVHDDSASVALVVRRQAIRIMLRERDGCDSCHSYAAGNAGDVKLPVDLRLKVRGGYILAFYRQADNSDWKAISPDSLIRIDLPQQVLTGVVAYSGDGTAFTEAWVSGYGSRCVCGDVPSAAAAVDLPEKADGQLFCERYDGGDLETDPDASLFWSGVKGANIVAVQDGAHTVYAWHKKHMPGKHFAGNARWADYAMTVRVMFPNRPQGRVAFWVRHRETACYGAFGYGVALANGNEIQIHRTFAGVAQLGGPVARTAISYAEQPDIWHTLRIEALDQQVTVFWDGEAVLSYTDENVFICGIGNIGLTTDAATDVYIGQIEVTELYDPNGAYDNLIGGGWDDQAPEDFCYSYTDGASWTAPDHG